MCSIIQGKTHLALIKQDEILPLAGWKKNRKLSSDQSEKESFELCCAY